MIYGMSEVQVTRALDELVRAKLVERDLRWYNMTPTGRDVVRSRTRLLASPGTGSLSPPPTAQPYSGGRWVLLGRTGNATIVA